jgi:adenine phosphoribosyltransferase
LDEQALRALIAEVTDFPRPGVSYKDITPLLATPEAFAAALAGLEARVADARPDALLAIESRGFIFGAALADRLRLPLQLVRKRGKLPRRAVGVAYALEYGEDHLEIHADALAAGGRYAIVDDVLATGGTAAAVADLVEDQGGIVAVLAFLLELDPLGGRARLGERPVRSLLRYSG